MSSKHGVDEWLVAECDREQCAAIEAHVTKYVGPPKFVFHEAHSELVHVDIHLVPPSNTHRNWFLFTTGMSALAMNIPAGLGLMSRAELCLTLPATWPADPEHWQRASTWWWPVRELQALARFPHRHRTWLGEGHTIARAHPPDPYDDSTELAAIMLVPSWVTNDGTIDETIELLSLWPLHAEELAFKQSHGACALLELLDAAGVTEMLDPDRRSVVPAKQPTPQAQPGVRVELQN